MSLHPDKCVFANRSSSNACIMVLPKLTFILHVFLSYHICSSATSWLQGELSTCNDCRSVYHASVKCQITLRTKCNRPSPFHYHNGSLIVGALTVMCESFVFCIFDQILPLWAHFGHTLLISKNQLEI